MMRVSRDARPNKVGSVSYRLVAALAAWKALGCPAKYGEAIGKAGRMAVSNQRSPYFKRA